MTQRFGHGLVIGKFYPPHRGHHHLVDVAADRCDAVTVLVMAAAKETTPLADRVAWVRAAHRGSPGVRVVGVPCDIPVDYADEGVWTVQVGLMRAWLDSVVGRGAESGVGRGVDVVFTGEAYGPELAARLGARHVPVDRGLIPVSGTAVRADPAGHWDLLAPATRAGLAARVVVLGAESTGTTTVAEMLAEHYRARGGVWARTGCVPEYGREHTWQKWRQATERARANALPEPGLDEIVWTHEDFDVVAAEQTRQEEAAARAGSPLLICDTDAFATAVWERRYLGGRARAGTAWASQLPRRDVYLLTSHEGVPWQDDGLREGDLDIRAAMTGWFTDALTRAGHSWVPLTGDLPERLRIGVLVTDQVLNRRLGFTTSITEATERAGLP